MFEEWTAKTGKTHGKAIVATQEDTRPVIIWGYILNKKEHKNIIQVGNKVQLKGKKSGENLIVNHMKLLESPWMNQYEVDLND